MLQFEKTTIVFRDYDGAEHKFGVPSYSELKKSQKNMIENIERADEVIVDSLVLWGVPREVLERFELTHIRKLWESILNTKKD